MRRKSAAARMTRLRMAARSLARRSHRHDRPVIALRLQRDVEVARLGLAVVLNRPAGGDVVLPLGADLARAALLERRRTRLAEQSVEQIRRLIAAEEAALVHEAGELELDL